MGMNYFTLLTGTRLNVPPYKPFIEKRAEGEKAFLMPDAVNITLAEYSPVSSEAITAHRLADYRQHRFSLVLLPDIHVLLEDLLDVPVQA